MSEVLSTRKTDSYDLFADRFVLQWRYTLTTLLVGAAYYAGAKLGFALTFKPYPVSVLWPPNAILLAALLLAPVQMWRLILLATFLAHLAAQHQSGVPTTMVLCWYISNSCEALIGAVCMRWFVHGPPRFNRLIDVNLFLIICVFTAPFLSSFLDAAFVMLNQFGQGYWQVWRVRFFSNVLATLTLVPVIVTWWTGGIALPARVSWKRCLEAGLLGSCLLALCLVLFNTQSAGPGNTTAWLYAPIPFLLWAAVRFRPQASSLSILVVVLLAIWGAAHGNGPFVSSSPADNARSLQLFLVVIATPLMCLTAVIQEKGVAVKAARQNAERLKLALEAARMGTWEWNMPDGKPLNLSQMKRTYSSASFNSDLTLHLDSMIHPEDQASVARALTRSLEQGYAYESEFRIVRPDGSVHWVLDKGKAFCDEQGQPIRMMGVSMDITERKREEAFLAEQRRILEMIATGAPLGEILTSLIILIESQLDGLLCSVLLLDRDGVHIRHGAAPNLPESYVKAIDGLMIGPRVGSCGTAMYRGQPVVVTDIMMDPLWEDYRDVAARHGLRACWSFPIFSREERVLGSFAAYYREPRNPSTDEIRLIEMLASIPGIAIEHKYFEEALRGSEERFSKAFRSSPDAIAISHRADARIIEINDKMIAMFGYGREEAIGYTPADINLYVNEGDRARLRALLDAQGYVRDCELKLRTRSGAIIRAIVAVETVELSGDPCMITIIRDVTEQKRAEEERKQTQTLHRAVLTSMHDLVAIINRDGLIIEVNESWARSTSENGIDNHQKMLPGANYLSVCRDAISEMNNDAARALAGINAVLSGEVKQFLMEYECHALSGVLWFEMSVEALQRPEGGAVIRHLNITKRKQAEMEAQERRREVTHLTRVAALGELSGALAHELNQPLTAMLSNAQAAQFLLDNDTFSRKELSDILADIAADNKRAGQVIHRLRSMLKKNKENYQPLDINQTIREVLVLTRGDLLSRQVVVSTDLEPALPLICGDRVQLQQVMLNLILNACDAMSGNDQSEKILLIRSEATQAGMIQLAVMDCGHGIQADVMEKLFEPFFSTKQQGLGMGLSICRSIVEAHHGTIRASNNKRLGATFHVQLPPLNNSSNKILSALSMAQD